MTPPDAATRPGAARRAWLWAPVILYGGLIFALSSISKVPALPGGMTDKAAHAMLYSGFGVLLARAIAGGLDAPFGGWTILAVAALSGAYGLSDEFHQLFVPNRQFDLKDLAADVVGGTAGSVLAWLWGILRRSRHAN